LVNWQPVNRLPITDYLDNVRLETAGIRLMGRFVLIVNE